MVLGGPKSVNTLHRMHQYCVILPRLLTSDAAPLHPQKPYVMNSAYVVQVDSCNEKPHCNLCNKICLQILNKKSFVTHERQSLKAFCSNLLEANAPFQIFSDTCSETDILTSRWPASLAHQQRSLSAYCLQLAGIEVLVANLQVIAAQRMRLYQGYHSNPRY